MYAHHTRTSYSLQTCLNIVLITPLHITAMRTITHPQVGTLFCYGSMFFYVVDITCMFVHTGKAIRIPRLNLVTCNATR
jgi:hypothetical protein